MRKAQAQDWLEDLAEFGPAIVAAACREWRQRPVNRRPAPGEIRALCIAEQKAQREREERALPSGERPWTYADRVAALRAKREANREAELANYERLKQLDKEIRAQRTGTLTLRTERVYTAEELRLGRIGLGLERAPDEVKETLRRDSIAAAREPWNVPAEAAE